MLGNSSVKNSVFYCCSRKNAIINGNFVNDCRDSFNFFNFQIHLFFVPILVNQLGVSNMVTLSIRSEKGM